MTVTSPITTFENMRLVLNILYENNSFSKKQSLQKEFIAKKMDKSVAIVNNALAMLRAMKLVSGGHRYQDTKVYLLNNGKLFIEILETGDKEKIKEFSIILIKKSKSDILQESHKLLKKDPQISYELIGRLVRKKIKYTKKPKSDVTYTNIGRTIKDILCGLQLIDKDEVRLRRRNIRERFTNKLYPNFRIVNIINAIENFKSDNTWQIDIPTQYNLERQDALTIARILIDLNIAYYIDYQNNILKLTNEGIELKKNLKNDYRREIFRSILLAHKPINNIIKRIIYLNRKISSIDVGNLISEYNKTDWKYTTKIGHGSALISWLKEADILADGGEQGRYVILDSFINEHRDKILDPEQAMKSRKTPNSIKEKIPITKDIIIGDIYKKIFSIRFMDEWNTQENQQYLNEKLNKLKKIDKSSCDWIFEAEKKISIAFEYSEKSLITEEVAKIMTLNLNEDL